eukprot:gene8498-13122_t
MEIQKEAMTNAMYCTAAMAANMLFCQMGQGHSRFAAGERPPEDSSFSTAAKLRKHGIEQNFVGSGIEQNDRNLKAKERAMRWSRVLMNTLENVPLGLITGWASLIATKGSRTQVLFFTLFAVSRWVHTVSFVYALQPWRAIGWLSGWIAIIGMLYSGIVAN